MVHLSIEINCLGTCVFDLKVDHLNGICVPLSDCERYSATQIFGDWSICFSVRLIELFISLTSLFTRYRITYASDTFSFRIRAVFIRLCMNPIRSAPTIRYNSAPHQ